MLDNQFDDDIEVNATSPRPPRNLFFLGGFPTSKPAYAAKVLRAPDGQSSGGGHLRIAVAAVFLNEETYLPIFLRSLAAQTRRPDLVLLVDDGSTDRSEEIAASFAAEHEGFEYVRLPARPPDADRLAQANELKAFQSVVDLLLEAFDVVAKVDADLDLAPNAIETVERAMLADAELGLVGIVLSERQDDGSLTPITTRLDHVEGAVKFYRSDCWRQIQPLQPILGWDTLDEFQARAHGWRTRSFPTEGAETEHLRRMGTHGAILRSFRRWGVCSYGYGAHPLQVGWYALVLMRSRKPRVIGGLNYLAGWAGAWIRRAPRAEAGIRREVRREQIGRLRTRLRSAVG
jgi:poly-beta-1,6-N-acetyl-D-glucosamine synthase